MKPADRRPIVLSNKFVPISRGMSIDTMKCMKLTESHYLNLGYLTPINLTPINLNPVNLNPVNPLPHHGKNQPSPF